METVRNNANDPPERNAMVARYARNRRRSLALFDLVSPEGYLSRPIPLRHPPVFYEGHLPSFSFSRLPQATFDRPSVDPELEKLFERGIDPSDARAAAAHERAGWPSRQEVQAFGRRCDEEVLATLERAPLEDPGDPMRQRAHSARTILEHEEMHHETFGYIVHRMPLEHKNRPPAYRTPADAIEPQVRRIEIPAGIATVGARRDATLFGWDNEFEAQQVDVAAFECDAHPVTNGDWLRFVAAGGPVPSFWIHESGNFRLRGAWELLDLPLSWPVWVSNEQARAYAAWAGRRIMTEAEYHRAAFGTPEGNERVFPWGSAAPASEHGNFDWQRWDPDPVGSHPAGASAWGIEELIGNGWEHTSTPFGPLPGFQPHTSYPLYSQDFFDGKHYVVKGASPLTAREHVRGTLRNWYYGDYPYAYTKFRTVSS